MLVRRGSLAAALSAAALLAAPHAGGSVGSSPVLALSLGRALAASDIDPRRTGALAVDLDSGHVVYRRNGALPLEPASVEKLAVTLAALRVLGPDFRFRTEVTGSGALVEHVWEGDLVLVGSGDPTLSLDDLSRLAGDVRRAGIAHVNGRVLGDEHRFDTMRGGPGWRPSFVGGQSAPLSALSVQDVPLHGPNSSAATAARAFRTALLRRGVSVSGVSGTGRGGPAALPLGTDLSAPLAAILREMNQESDNFVAEMLVKKLGATVAPRGSTKIGARVVRDVLAEAGIPLAGVRIVDGSGLSRGDRMTVRTLVAVLESGRDDPSFGRVFVDSLSVAGVSGTLEHRLTRRATKGRVRAKTGTTDRASALAGFVGRRYVFAILQNGSPLDYWSARLAQDRFVTTLARR